MQLEAPVLVVAAHPDDEVLGAGGVLSRMGGSVLVLCDPYTKGTLDVDRLEASQRAAALVMGTSHTIAYRWAHLEDEKLDLGDAVTCVEKMIDTLAPATVVCPWIRDMNQDHRTAAEAVSIAARLSRRESVRQVLMMEIASSSEQGFYPFRPEVFVEFDWTVKKTMLEAYAHELSYAPDRSIELLEAYSVVRGRAVGVTHAEGFVLLRGVFRAE